MKTFQTSPLLQIQYIKQFINAITKEVAILNQPVLVKMKSIFSYFQARTECGIYETTINILSSYQYMITILQTSLHIHSYKTSKAQIQF